MLEGLLRQGALLPSRCRSGSCRKCMVRHLGGVLPPEISQKTLRDTLRAQGFFLPCQCVPGGDMEIAPIQMSDCRYRLEVISHQKLTPEILRLRLKPEPMPDYFPGQYINLIRSASADNGEEMVRSYSIASHPGDDHLLELHIQRTGSGGVSQWLHDVIRPGDVLDAFGPAGDCFFLPGDPHQPLLMVAVETGMAAIYGILKSALHHQHKGPIYLFHGAATAGGHYLNEEIRALSHTNLHYAPLVVEEAPISVGLRLSPPINLGSQVTRQHPDLSAMRLYLCGPPQQVKDLRRDCFLAGAQASAIYTVSFEV